jgi:hypothetical protein
MFISIKYACKVYILVAAAASEGATSPLLWSAMQQGWQQANSFFKWITFWFVSSDGNNFFKWIAFWFGSSMSANVGRVESSLEPRTPVKGKKSSTAMATPNIK